MRLLQSYLVGSYIHFVHMFHVHTCTIAPLTQLLSAFSCKVEVSDITRDRQCKGHSSAQGLSMCIGGVYIYNDFAKWLYHLL